MGNTCSCLYQKEQEKALEFEIAASPSDEMPKATEDEEVFSKIKTGEENQLVKSDEKGKDASKEFVSKYSIHQIQESEDKRNGQDDIDTLMEKSLNQFGKGEDKEEQKVRLSHDSLEREEENTWMEQQPQQEIEDYQRQKESQEQIDEQDEDEEEEEEQQYEQDFEQEEQEEEEQQQPVEDQDEEEQKSEIQPDIQQIDQGEDQNNTYMAISGARKKFPKVIAQLQLFNGCKLVGGIINQTFPQHSQDSLVLAVAKGQVVYSLEEPTEIDFSDNSSIVSYFAMRGTNFKEIYSLELLAQGAEAVTWNVDMKQPFEAVVKTVLPEQMREGLVEELIEEAQLMKALESKEHVARVYEEIIEIEAESNQVMSYISVIEHAHSSLSSLIETWQSYDKRHSQLEFFSNFKLFYLFLQSAKALAYLHSNNVYYGDMKEQNLQVFEDYSVKLGDFGLAIKMEEEGDPEEKIYELKGGMAGFVQPQMYAAFVLDSEERFSKNELIANDYYALEQTFYKIYEMCREEFSAEAINEEDQGLLYKFFSYSFDENSHFCQLLNDIHNLHPEKNPLASVVNQYEQMIENDDEFLIEFCEQLVADDKFSALPNVLGLWRHRGVVQSIKEFFDQEEIKEFPFANHRQKSINDEELAQDNEDVQQIDQDQLIQQLQGYISANLGDNFIVYIDKIIRYRGALDETFYNNFYRALFSLCFTFTTQDSTFNLADLLQEDRSQLFDYIDSISLQENMALFGNVTNFRHLKDPNLLPLVQFLLFIGLTTNRTDQLEYLIVNLVRKMECLGRCMLEMQMLKDNGGDMEMVGLILTFVKHLDELNLLQMQKNFQFLNQVENLFKVEDTLMRQCYPFSYKQELVSELFKLVENQENVSESRIFQRVFYPLFEDQDNMFHKASQLSFIQNDLYQLQSYSVDNVEEFLQTLRIVRSTNKRTCGALGDNVNRIGYEIYKATKQLQQAGQASPEDEQDGFLHLIKACTHSISSQRLEFLLDLLLELSSQNSPQFSAYLESAQSQNGLFYQILKAAFYQEQVDSNECSQLKLELLTGQSQQLFKAVMERNEGFKKMLIDFLGLDEDLVSMELEFVTKEYIVAEFVPLLCNLVKENGQTEYYDELVGCMVKFEQTQEGQLLTVEFSNGALLSAQLQNLVLHGTTNYQNEYRDGFEAGVRSGEFNYETANYQVQGEVGGMAFVKVLSEGPKDFLNYFEKKGPLTMVVEGEQPLGEQIQQQAEKNFTGVFQNQALLHGRKQAGYLHSITKTVDIADGKKQGPRLNFSEFQIFKIMEYVMGVKNTFEIEISHQDNFFTVTEQIAENECLIKEYYLNGSLMSEYSVMKEGEEEYQKQGQRFRYFQSGVLADEENFDNGLYIQPYTKFYQNTQPSVVIAENLNSQITFNKQGELIGKCAGDEQDIIEGASFRFDQRNEINDQCLVLNGFILEEREFYEDGQLRALTMFIDGEKQGHLYFFRNGGVKEMFVLDDDGGHTMFYDIEGSQIDDYQNVEFYDNGNIRKVEENQEVFWLYYDNGQLRFSNSSYSQFSDIYDRDGNVLIPYTQELAIELDEAGNISQVTNDKCEWRYHENGQLLSLNDKEARVETVYSVHGTYSMKIKILDEESDFLTQEFFQNGQHIGSLQMKGKYQLKQGKILYFYGQNLLQMIEVFEENNLKQQVLFYPNGKVLREAHYVDWALEGVERCFYPNGSCYKQAEYSQGICHGLTIFYSPHGEVDCLLEFERGEVLRKCIFNSIFSALADGGESERNEEND